MEVKAGETRPSWSRSGQEARRELVHQSVDHDAGRLSPHAYARALLTSPPSPTHRHPS